MVESMRNLLLGPRHTGGAAGVVRRHASHGRGPALVCAPRAHDRSSVLAPVRTARPLVIRAANDG
jgi:hypothetical protein